MSLSSMRTLVIRSSGLAFLISSGHSSSSTSIDASLLSLWLVLLLLPAPLAVALGADDDEALSSAGRSAPAGGCESLILCFYPTLRRTAGAVLACSAMTVNQPSDGASRFAQEQAVWRRTVIKHF